MYSLGLNISTDSDPGSNIEKWREPSWYDRINMQELENLAGIGYEPRQIAMYFRIPLKEFMWYFNLIGSPIKYSYERGQLLHKAKEGINMQAAAEKGDNATQAQRFDKHRRALGYKNSVHAIFFDDIESI